MAFPINTLVSLGIFLTCLTGLGSGLLVVSKPQPYTALTKKLSISCVVDGPKYLNKSVVSIRIMKHTDAKPIATVNMRQELKMAVGIKGNVKAEGHIDQISSKSYLTLIIDNPETPDGGMYRCQMFFTDENLQMVEENAIGKVTHKTLVADGWKYYEADMTFIKAFGKDDRSKRRNWPKARATCQELGGDLVQIRDEDKNTFVYKMFAGKRDLNAWIGIENVAKNGFDFKYVDGSALGTYHPWHLVRRDGNKATNDKCVTLITHATSHPRQWYDDLCSYYKPFVCSVPLRTLTHG